MDKDIEEEKKVIENLGKDMLKKMDELETQKEETSKVCPSCKKKKHLLGKPTKDIAHRLWESEFHHCPAQMPTLSADIQPFAATA